MSAHDEEIQLLTHNCFNYHAWVLCKNLIQHDVEIPDELLMAGIFNDSLELARTLERPYEPMFSSKKGLGMNNMMIKYLGHPQPIVHEALEDARYGKIWGLVGWMHLPSFFMFSQRLSQLGAGHGWSGWRGRGLLRQTMPRDKLSRKIRRLQGSVVNNNKTNVEIHRLTSEFLCLKWWAEEDWSWRTIHGHDDDDDGVLPRAVSGAGLELF